MNYAGASAPPYGGSEPPPPSYAQVSDTKCSYVDFIPKCLETAGLFTMPVYETFDVLMERANAWLRNHPTWKVISCESVESKLKGEGTGIADTSRSSYTVHGNANTIYNRSVRLWICNKTPADNPHPQHIGCMNVVPQPKSDFYLSKPDFDTFPETIEKINETLARHPIEGRIINMETQNMKFKSYDNAVHADKCVWREYGNANMYFLNIVRVFYESGQGIITRIGVADFVPSFDGYLYEPFSATMMKANTWISQQPPHLNICNLQSLQYKVAGGRRGGNVNTSKPLYLEYGKINTKYLRTVRVYYSEGNDYTQPPRQSVLQVSYRTFLPFQRGHMEFEPIPEVAERMHAWINATGAKVLSCETLKLRVMDKRQKGNPEVSYTSNDHYDSRYILALRLYLDGAYSDPPPGVLPPGPNPDKYTQSDDQCVIA